MAVTEEEAAAATEADVEAVEAEELAVVHLEPAVLRRRGPRRRTSWTWPSTWTRPSSSSSTAAEKVWRSPTGRDKEATRKENKG